MTGLALGPGRVCTATGLGLLAATAEAGWRITKDAYVQTSGITAVLVNDVVGPLPPGSPDRRCRYDTLGRTVYFAGAAKTALDEVLQNFRVRAMSLTKDAAAIGMEVVNTGGRWQMIWTTAACPCTRGSAPRLADGQQLVQGEPAISRLVGTHRLADHPERPVRKDERVG